MAQSVDKFWKEARMRRSCAAWVLCWCLACTSDRQEPSRAPEPPPREAPVEDTTVVDTVMARDTARGGDSE